MKGNPLALIWAAGEAKNRGSRSVPLCQPLLGKSILELAVEAVHGLRPRKILLSVGDDDKKGAASLTGILSLKVPAY